MKSIPSTVPVVNAIQRTILDPFTKEKLVALVGQLEKRKQTKEIQEIYDMTESLLEGKSNRIHKLLRRAHNNIYFKGSQPLRYFMRFYIPTWIHSSYKAKIYGHETIGDKSYTSPNKIANLQYPKIERDLPIAESILQKNHQLFQQEFEKLRKGDAKYSEIEPIPIQLPPKGHKENQEKMDLVVRHVFKLMNFLGNGCIFHTRKLGSPVVTIPCTPLGEEIPEVRKKNIIQSHISYMRRVFQQYPPIMKEDCDKLLAFTDDPKNFRIGTYRENTNMRREYRKFLRTSYTIDHNGDCHYTKHAYSQPKELEPRLQEVMTLGKPPVKNNRPKREFLKTKHN